MSCEHQEGARQGMQNHGQGWVRPEAKRSSDSGQAEGWLEGGGPS